MNNYLYIGNYCLSENFQTAGGKRVLNQIKYFDTSCKSSVLLIPGLRKYINLLKPQPTKVDAYF